MSMLEELKNAPMTLVLDQNQSEYREWYMLTNDEDGEKLFAVVMLLSGRLCDDDDHVKEFGNRYVYIEGDVVMAYPESGGPLPVHKWSIRRDLIFKALGDQHD